MKSDPANRHAPGPKPANKWAEVRALTLVSHPPRPVPFEANDLPARVFQPRSRAPMYLSVKKPRKTDRKRSIRHRAKVKAKNRTRRARVNANG